LEDTFMLAILQLQKKLSMATFGVLFLIPIHPVMDVRGLQQKPTVHFVAGLKLSPVFLCHLQSTGESTPGSGVI
jgi:hypothetical protein